MNGGRQGNVFISNVDGIMFVLLSGQKKRSIDTVYFEFPVLFQP